MPSWKRVIVSGSNAALNSLTVSNGITGSLFGTASFATTALSSSFATNALTASFVAISSTNTDATHYLHFGNLLYIKLIITISPVDMVITY